MNKFSDIRIVFYGTSPFAIPAFEGLIARNWNVIAVVTNPDEPAGRSQTLTPPPMKIAAASHKIPVFQPHNLKTELSSIPEHDLAIIAAFGTIIPQELIAAPRLGALNIHPSLLPRWRGPSPLQFTILQGDTEAGVSIMQIDELMDHGPLLAQQTYPLSLEHPMPYPELHDELARAGANLLLHTLPEWTDGRIAPVAQDDNKATYSKLLKKNDGRIDWSRPAEHIERMVRAFTPWPGTWTVWPSADRIYRIRIEAAAVSSEDSGVGSAGYVWSPEKNRMLVKTGNQSLEILSLTMEGKKPMDVASFLHGFPHLNETTFV